MGFLEIALIAATFLCSLVAGLVFAFAVVVMPGIKTLPDRDFIRAFQVIDRVIQNNQPVFMLAWVGSALSLLVTAGFGISQLTGSARVMLILATAIYFLAVQIPTITINIPLNNRLQTLDVENMSEEALKTARSDFEPRWNRWNTVRTIFACLVTLSLLSLLVQL